MMKTVTKIKIELLKKGITSARIAESLGVDRTYISHVLAGRFKTPKIRKAIAQAIDMRVEELWPEDDKKAA